MRKETLDRNCEKVLDGKKRVLAESLHRPLKRKDVTYEETRRKAKSICK